MKFGAQVTCYRNTWDEIRNVAEALDAGPWDSIWFADHFLPPPGRTKEEEHLAAHEGFTVAAAVAGFTRRLRVGHLVLGNTYRNPSLTAKMAGTVDHISHGRFVLGIGTAWFNREHVAYGWTFPSMRERQDRFEEAVELLRRLFHADAPVTYQGDYYSLDDVPLSPGSYDEPIPILVGGTGERRTLRTLARYGDIMNLDGWSGGPLTKEHFHHKVGVVNCHCEDAGRDPGEIRHTVLIPIMVTDDKAAAAEFMNFRRLGEGSAVGPRNYVIDRIGEIVDAGPEEIMIAGVPTDVECFQFVAEEVLSAFD